MFGFDDQLYNGAKILERTSFQVKLNMYDVNPVSMHQSQPNYRIFVKFYNLSLSILNWV